MPLGLGFGWLFAGGTVGSPGTLPRPYVETMLWVNDTPLQLAGVTLQRPSGWLNGVARVLPEVDPIPGFTSGTYGTLPTTRARDVQLTGVMLNVPLEQQTEALRTLQDLFAGEVELRWPHAPTQVMRGVAGELQPTPLKDEQAFVIDRHGNIPLVVTWTVRCKDAAVYEQHPRRVRLGTTPKRVVMGGLPVGGELLLEGPLSGAVDFEILNASGGLLWRLALRGVSLAGETEDVGADSCTIRLDAPNTIVKRTGLGVESNAYHWRSLELSSPWDSISPLYADRARGQFPFARLSTGGGWLTYVIGNMQ